MLQNRKKMLKKYIIDIERVKSLLKEKIINELVLAVQLLTNVDLIFVCNYLVLQCSSPLFMWHKRLRTLISCDASKLEREVWAVSIYFELSEILH